jgi:hypothetical protein
MTLTHELCAPRISYAQTWFCIINPSHAYAGSYVKLSAFVHKIRALHKIIRTAHILCALLQKSVYTAKNYQFYSWLPYKYFTIHDVHRRLVHETF